MNGIPEGMVLKRLLAAGIPAALEHTGGNVVTVYVPIGHDDAATASDGEHLAICNGRWTWEVWHAASPEHDGSIVAHCGYFSVAERVLSLRESLGRRADRRRLAPS